jgi:endonuclease III
MSTTAKASRFFGRDPCNDFGSNSDNDDTIITTGTTSTGSHDCFVNVENVPVTETNRRDWQFMNQRVLGDNGQKEDGRQMEGSHGSMILEQSLHKKDDVEAIPCSSAAKQIVSKGASENVQQDDEMKKDNVDQTELCVNKNDHEIIVIDEDSVTNDDQPGNVAGIHVNANLPMGQTLDNEDKDKESFVQGEITPKKNPFAQFAFGSTSNTAGALPRGRKWVVSKTQFEPKAKKAKTSTTAAIKNQKPEWKPMAELSADEQERVRHKWLGLVVMPHDSSLEDARFQVMVASRLHARCQEPVVRKCMTLLYNARVLTCRALADYNVDALASLLTTLQYYNTKSKHLIQASKELLERFDGKVPESKDDLLTITGIGPVMADLLSTINSREAHRSYAARSSNS